MNSRYDAVEPLLLKPAAKDYLWGGDRLNTEYGKSIDASPLAETWECSTHPNGKCYVASGRYAGMALDEVLKQHPEYIGAHPKTDGNGALPILIKLIDANKDLSIQVHPTDDYAETHENGQLGKSELWYVLEATDTAEIIYGYKFDVNEDVVRQALKNNSIAKLLNTVPVKTNDAFFIEAGTVHAIGAGCLIAEIQENSDLTYRLYDYDRIDKNGKKRALHIEKALEVMDYHGSTDVKQPMRLRRFFKGYATDFLCNCKYFRVEKIMIYSEAFIEPERMFTDLNSFSVLLCVQGMGSLKTETISVEIKKGDCFFIPAVCKNFSVKGNMTLLKVVC